MHAVARSPDNFYWDCRSGRDEQCPERLLQEKKNWLERSSVSFKARRYPDFIRKNSPNPNEFAQFAFNLLILPDDHATNGRSSRAVSFTQSRAALPRRRRQRVKRRFNENADTMRPIGDLG